MTLPFLRVLAVLALSISATQVRADLMFTMEEIGPDVVLSASGSIDTSKLTPFAQWFSTPVGAINPAEGQIILGVGFVLGNRYELVQGATVFGLGNGINATSSSGDAIDLHGTEQFIGLPPGYVSGTPITTTMTFAGQTFQTLGVIPRTWDWLFGDGQTVTLQIGAAAAVPEPASVVAMAIGLSLCVLRFARPSSSRFRT